MYVGFPDACFLQRGVTVERHLVLHGIHACAFDVVFLTIRGHKFVVGNIVLSAVVRVFVPVFDCVVIGTHDMWGNQNAPTAAKHETFVGSCVFRDMVTVGNEQFVRFVECLTPCRVNGVGAFGVFLIFVEQV